MRLFLWALFYFIVATGSGFASVIELTGKYTTPQQWDADTLLIKGTVLILLPDSEEIVIQPGTTILFAGNHALKSGNYSLKLQGTAEKPIRFTSLDTLVRWSGVVFDQVIYSTSGVYYKNDTTIKNDTVSITHCIAEYCANTNGVFTFFKQGTNNQRTLLIEHCTFRNNKSSGLYFNYPNSKDSSGAIIRNCRFENNLRNAIYSNGFSAQITDNTFDGMKSTPLSLWDADCYIEGNRFENNIVTDDASAIYHVVNSDTNRITIVNNLFSNNHNEPVVHLIRDIPVITGNTFLNNRANNQDRGCGIYLNCTFAAAIASNSFIGNSIGEPDSLLPGGSGGALYINYVYDTVTVSNNLFAKNLAFRGAAIFLTGSSPCFFINNTLTENRGFLSPAIYSDNFKGKQLFVNNCFYDNHTLRTDDTVVYQVYFYRDSIVEFRNCLFERQDSAIVYQQSTGCIFGEPKFVDAAKGNYAPADGSLCINNGDNILSGFSESDTDLAGKSRIEGGTIDIGAYEFINPVYSSIKPTKAHHNTNIQPYILRLTGTKKVSVGSAATYLLNGSVLTRKIGDKQCRSLRHVVVLKKND